MDCRHNGDRLTPRYLKKFKRHGMQPRIQETAPKILAASSPTAVRVTASSSREITSSDDVASSGLGVSFSDLGSRDDEHLHDVKATFYCDDQYSGNWGMILANGDFVDANIIPVDVGLVDPTKFVLHGKVAGHKLPLKVVRLMPISSLKFELIPPPPPTPAVEAATVEAKNEAAVGEHAEFACCYLGYQRFSDVRPHRSP